MPRVCVNCKHCEAGTPIGAAGSLRLCKLCDAAHEPTHCCKFWDATQLHKSIGSGEPGSIKKKEYLKAAYQYYVCKDRSLVKAPYVDIEHFRMIWEQENKTSIYLLNNDRKQ